METYRRHINVRFDIETYKKIEMLAHKEGRSMSDVVREWVSQGLNGTLTENNIEFLGPIIREQIKNVIDPKLERMLSLQAKTCVQASTATFLTADAILKFVPPTQRAEVKESYETARKQAVIYLKEKADMSE